MGIAKYLKGDRFIKNRDKEGRYFIKKALFRLK
jgi:hypothetical protein